jgi:hypothetical protein
VDKIEVQRWSELLPANHLFNETAYFLIFEIR